MNRTERAQWQTARTLEDLGALGARWLEGDLDCQPGYDWGGPDEETLPLVPLLALLNRSGFYTTCSQPGFSGDDDDGVPWEQRAYCEGFASAELTGRIQAAARRERLCVSACDPAKLPRWRVRYSTEIPVTRRAGVTVTSCGHQIPRRYIASPHLGWGICHPDAVAALAAAWQVIIVDPAWGRTDRLWRALAAICTNPPEEAAS